MPKSDQFSFHFTVCFEDGGEWSVSEDSSSDDDDEQHSAMSHIMTQYPEAEDIRYEGVENNYPKKQKCKQS